MGDMREYFEPYKELHKQRVAKNPERLEYAVKLLKENGITFKVCNETTGQINCYFANGKCLTFYAGTGKIQGYKNARGIRTFIRICQGEKIPDKISLKEGAEE
jgi:pimeloyl-CoA synthetase